jgi:hypothetical protein
MSFRALEEGWPSPSDKALDELDPDGEHLGVLVCVFGWDGKFGSTVPRDALGIVSWLLALDRRDERAIVHVGVPVEEILALPRVQIAGENC